MTETERFWGRVDKGCLDGCWLWMGPKNKKGYGHIGINGKTVSAHRFSYSINVGAIPDGLHVLHTCDNRPCVNPKHLWVGTNLENVLDCIKKGRAGTLFSLRGEAHSKAKLTAADVLEIRELNSDGFSGSQLGDIYGVHPNNIFAICNRKTWAHVV